MQVGTISQLLLMGQTRHQQGSLSEAESAYRQVLQLDSRNPTAWYLLGLVACQTGRLPAAVEYLGNSISGAPRNPAAHFNRGEAYRQLGQLADAERCLRKAVELQSDYVDAFNTLGIVLLDQGKFDSALASFRKCTLLDPGYAQAVCNLARVAELQGDDRLARQEYERAIGLNGALPEAWNGLGVVERRLGDGARSIGCFERAIRLRPGYRDACLNLAEAFHENGEPERALACYADILATDASDVDALVGRARLALASGATDEALRCFGSALRATPEHTDALVGMAAALVAAGRPDEAREACEKAIGVSPDFAAAHAYLAALHQRFGRVEDALAFSRRCLELDPDNRGARLSLISQLMQACEWHDLEAQLEQFRRQCSGPGGQGRARPASPFPLLSLPGTTPLEQKTLTEEWTRVNLRSSRPRSAAACGGAVAPVPGAKVRIGYLSPDFGDHPVARQLVEVLELHDRERFEIIAYSSRFGTGGAIQERIGAAVSAFHDVRGDAHEQLADRIRADGIDILVDLGGHTSNSALGALAYRPAPVQVSFLGYPGTLGTGFVDYLIADPFVVPPGREPCYSERIIRLPGCFFPADRTRERRPAPERPACALPENAVVFCCFHQTFKITPSLFDVWCRLLRAVPGSVLWLARTGDLAAANLKRAAGERGVAPSRLVFASRVDAYEDHLARLQCADLLLDTTPYNAHSTCNDALWMGVPVVTCAGDTFASRVAGSQLLALGLPELVTGDLEAYFGVACELATRADLRESMRRRIRIGRDGSPLFDTPAYTRHLEAAYLSMLAGDSGGQPVHGAG